MNELMTNGAFDHALAHVGNQRRTIVRHVVKPGVEGCAWLHLDEEVERPAPGYRVTIAGFSGALIVRGSERNGLVLLVERIEDDDGRPTTTRARALKSHVWRRNEGGIVKSNEIIPVGPALFFDGNGCGPDHVELTVSALRSLPDIPGSGGLALTVSVADGEIGMLVKEGGFCIKRDTIAELHRKLGEYLGHASEHNAAFTDEQASKKIRALDALIVDFKEETEHRAAVSSGGQHVGKTSNAFTAANHSTMLLFARALRDAGVDLEANGPNGA